MQKRLDAVRWSLQLNATRRGPQARHQLDWTRGNEQRHLRARSPSSLLATKPSASYKGAFAGPACGDRLRSRQVRGRQWRKILSAKTRCLLTWATVNSTDLVSGFKNCGNPHLALCCLANVWRVTASAASCVSLGKPRSAAEGTGPHGRQHGGGPCGQDVYTEPELPAESGEAWTSS